MRQAWRIVKTARVHQAFDGEGARRYGGRWNSPGTSMVYSSDSKPLALLEILVHLETVTTTLSFKIIPISIPEKLIDELSPMDLPPNWDSLSISPKCQEIGDDWIKSAKTPALAVPSAIIPSELNFLLNPAHPDFTKIKTGTPEDFRLDTRLATNRNRPL